MSAGMRGSCGKLFVAADGRMIARLSGLGAVPVRSVIAGTNGRLYAVPTPLKRSLSGRRLRYLGEVSGIDSRDWFRALVGVDSVADARGRVFTVG
jgi:hypothetical protein